MKTNSEKLLNEIYVLTDDQRIKDKVLQILRIEQSQAKGKFDYYKFVSKDEIRPVMTGVYHDNGFKVASDYHILVAIKEGYSNELEGKSLCKNGEFADGRYPNWRSVTPQLSELGARKKQVVEIDFAKWDEVFSVYKAEKKLGEQKQHVKVGESYYKVELFALVVAAMKRIGTSEWMNTYAYEVTMMGSEAVERKRPRTGISQNESGDLVLLMPCDYDGEDGYYEL